MSSNGDRKICTGGKERPEDKTSSECRNNQHNSARSQSKLQPYLKTKFTGMSEVTNGTIFDIRVVLAKKFNDIYYEL